MILIIIIIIWYSFFINIIGDIKKYLIIKEIQKLQNPIIIII